MEAQTVFVLFLLVANLLGMLFFWLVLKNRFAGKRVLSELRTEVDKLITDLGLEADRDVALLESRIHDLRALMDEADKRILLSGKTSRKKEEDSIVLSGVSVPEPITVSTISRVVESKPQVKPVNESPPVAIPPAEPVIVYTKPRIVRRENLIEPVIPQNERVIEMARKGISADMIASTLSVSLGEVELIIDMNRSSL
jgi:hypothetical protein